MFFVCLIPFLTFFLQITTQYVERLHAPIEAAGNRPAGIGHTADAGTFQGRTFEMNRVKNLNDGVPVSVGMHQASIIDDDGSLVTQKTAAGLAANKKQLYEKIGFSELNEQRDVLGFIGDGLYEKHGVPTRMQEMYKYHSLHVNITDLAHLIEKLIKKVCTYIYIAILHVYFPLRQFHFRLLSFL